MDRHAYVERRKDRKGWCMGLGVYEWTSVSVWVLLLLQDKGGSFLSINGRIQTKSASHGTPYFFFWVFFFFFFVFFFKKNVFHGTPFFFFFFSRYPLSFLSLSSLNSLHSSLSSSSSSSSSCLLLSVLW